LRTAPNPDAEACRPLLTGKRSGYSLERHFCRDILPHPRAVSRRAANVV